MRAVLFEDVGKLSVGEYPDPSIEDPGDALVRVTTAAICGSDLHLLHGRVPGLRAHSPIGHEFVGVVEAVGDAVREVHPGDRVVGSFLIACGACWFCARGEYNNCDDLKALGYGMFTGDLDGAQAEHVRVPVADLNLKVIEDGLADEQAIFAGDILTTAAYICARAGVAGGDTVAIIGAGPVGLFTLMHALAERPEVVYVVDMAAERLELAERLGGVPVDATRFNPVVEIQSRTGERGADVVIECVGAAPAFTTALDAVRAGGTIGVIGVYTDLSYDLPLGEVWRRGVTLAMGGTTNVHAHWDRTLDLVRAGAIDPTVIISHTMPLAEAMRGYELFEAREAMKVILKP